MFLCFLGFLFHMYSVHLVNCRAMVSIPFKQIPALSDTVGHSLNNVFTNTPLRMGANADMLKKCSYFHYEKS